jgi:hypothetical protein
MEKIKLSPLMNRREKLLQLHNTYHSICDLLTLGSIAEYKESCSITGSLDGYSSDEESASAENKPLERKPAKSPPGVVQIPRILKKGDSLRHMGEGRRIVKTVCSSNGESITSKKPEGTTPEGKADIMRILLKKGDSLRHMGNMGRIVKTIPQKQPEATPVARSA